MNSQPTRPSLVCAVVVALATLFALALPEGHGGRDHVVSLTRGTLQRPRGADTTALDHGDAEWRIGWSNGARIQRGRADHTTSPLAAAGLSMLPVPSWRPVSDGWPESVPGPARRPGHAASDRAPPAL